MKKIIQEKNVVIELKDAYSFKHRITERPAKLLTEATMPR